MGQITASATIPFGTALRVGYRGQGSAAPFTYFTFTPAYNQLPYTFPDSISPGLYEAETTTICPNCSGSSFSTPVITNIEVV